MSTERVVVVINFRDEQHAPHKAVSAMIVQMELAGRRLGAPKVGRVSSHPIHFSASIHHSPSLHRYDDTRLVGDQQGRRISLQPFILWCIPLRPKDLDPTDEIDTLPPLPLNTVLILAGTLHGIHAITSKLTPAPPHSASVGGLDSFEAEGWGGKVFLTPTGESSALLYYFYLSFGAFSASVMDVFRVRNMLDIVVEDSIKCP